MFNAHEWWYPSHDAGPVRLRRAGVALTSAQGQSAVEIAMMFAASENYAREVIHAFNEQGFRGVGA